MFVCSAFAQQGQSSIQGKVVDASGASLPGATILITHEGSGVFRNVVSNSDGSYFATGLVPGPYKVEAELSGFTKFVRGGLLLQVGSSLSLEIKLEIGTLEQNITVTGESPIIDVTSTQVATNISNQELAGAADSQPQLARRRVAGAGHPAGSRRRLRSRASR